MKDPIPVMFVYRDNHLYEKEIPVIIDALRDGGEWSIDKMVIPENTGDEWSFMEE